MAWRVEVIGKQVDVYHNNQKIGYVKSLKLEQTGTGDHVLTLVVYDKELFMDIDVEDQYVKRYKIGEPEQISQIINDKLGITKTSTDEKLEISAVPEIELLRKKYGRQAVLDIGNAFIKAFQIGSPVRHIFQVEEIDPETPEEIKRSPFVEPVSDPSSYRWKED
jgi:hypothetical protein